MKYSYKFKVRFEDTDAYGIVHHSRYYNYFEEARIQFSADVLGFNPEPNSETILKFPVIESSCIYKNPINFSLNYFIVDLEYKIIDISKLEFTFVILDENRKKKYAYGKTVHVLVNEQNKLCLELPKWIMGKMES